MQMRQKLHLLRMSGRDLEDFVNGEIERNPFLLRRQDATVGLGVTGLTTSPMPDLLDQAQVNQRPTLQAHVREQISVNFSKQQERHIALYLSDGLDENGYFDGDFDQCADLLGVDVDLVANVFLRLQKLEPPGLFARTLAECLRLQLEYKNQFDSVFAQLLQELTKVARRDYEILARLCGISQGELKHRLAQIKKLNPKPGLIFDFHPESFDNPVILPDAFVDARPDGSLHVTLNRATLPKLIMNEDYKKIVGSSKSECQFIKQYRNRAHWLIRTLDERAQILLTIFTSIMEEQTDFLHKGETALKPLNLSNIAEKTGMHVSTISRAIAEKYVVLSQNGKERGLYALRRFFSAPLGRNAQKSAFASKAVEARLAQIIAAEKTPLSDAALVEILKSEGIIIARRTIAKYRENLRLAPSHQRRKSRKV